MTIVYRRVSDSEITDTPDVATIRIVGKEDIEAFAQLVRRALNTWDEAPASIKEFGDIVTEGKILQDYSSYLAGSRRS